jgi:uncharacterized UBP type Zn finger protein
MESATSSTSTLSSDAKLDCPHVHNLLAQRQYFMNVMQALISIDEKQPHGECTICEKKDETMCCFECGDFFCTTKDKRGHIVDHFRSEREYSMREAGNFA